MPTSPFHLRLVQEIAVTVPAARLSPKETKTKTDADHEAWEGYRKVGDERHVYITFGNLPFSILSPFLPLGPLEMD